MKPLLLISLILAPSALFAQTKPPAKISLAQPVPVKQDPKHIQWPGANVATQCYGFFCKQELKMDKQTPMPVRFRLGSMQQTDWLESKPNARKPQQ